MCLHLTNQSYKITQDLIEKHKKNNTQIIAYKLLRLSDQLLHKNCTLTMQAPYYNLIYNFGENTSNRSQLKEFNETSTLPITQLIKYEMEDMVVSLGLHCLFIDNSINPEVDIDLIKKVAQDPQGYKDKHLFQVHIYPNDLISTGYWAYNGFHFPSLVCNKLTLLNYFTL